MPNNIGFETDLSIEEAAAHISTIVASHANEVKQVRLDMKRVQLISWHFEYKESLMECSLTHAPDFPVPWLLAVNTQIPIEFNVYGNYQADEHNVGAFSETLMHGLERKSNFHQVKRYSNQELRKFGIG